MKVAVILPAAGLGTRMGRTQPETGGTSRKQFMLLDGAPILVHTIRKFAASPLVGEIVVALRAEDIEWVSELLRRENLPYSPQAKLRDLTVSDIQMLENNDDSSR